MQILYPLKNCKETNLFRRKFAKLGKNGGNAKVTGGGWGFLVSALGFLASLIPDAKCTSYTFNCKYQRCVQHLHIYISMCCVSVLLVFVSAESNVGLIPWEEAVRECGKYLGISFAGDVTHQRWILSRGTRDITRLYHFTCNHTRLNQQWCVSLYNVHSNIHQNAATQK